MHDAISLRIRDKMAKAHGKVPIIDGSQIQGSGAKEFEEDIKKLGFTVLNLASTDPGDPTVRPLVQYADFTMDADIRALLTLKQEEERLMNDMYNTSPIVMGTQQTYTGYGTQQSAISQATMSIVNDTQAHIQFLSNVLQYSINLAKNFYTTKEGMPFAKNIFSNRAIKLLEESKDLRFEDMSVVVDILDNIDQVERKELLMLAQTIIPTGNLPALEMMVELQGQQTKTGLKNAISYIINKQKRQEEENKKIAMMQQAALMDAQNQANMEQQSMKNEAEAYKADTAADAAVETAEISAFAKQQPQQPQP